MIVVFDLETTGVNTQEDRIVQLAALKVNEDLVEKERLVLNINPTIPIPKGASRVHGIYDKDVQDCATFVDVVDSVIDFFDGCDVAGYNIIEFDIPLLDAELRRCGKKIPVGNMHAIDAFAVYKKFEGGSGKGKNLTNAYRFYCSEELGDAAHNALSDTLATTAILEAQVEQYKDHLTCPVASVYDLHKWTIGDNVDPTGKFQWNADGDAAISFGKYKGRTLEHLSEYEPNYLRWMLKSDFSSEVHELIRGALDGDYPSILLPRTKPLWHREECSVCRQESLSTRAEDVPADGDHFYEDCEMNQDGQEGERAVPKVCDVCCGEAKTLTGDACVCGDGTQSGLVKALRFQLREVGKDRERRDAQEQVKDVLLRDINEWMARMDFDGQGFVLQQRIKRLYWPNLVEEIDPFDPSNFCLLDHPTGTKCSDCGESQYNSPSGVTCPNGHGEASAKEKENT